jgi:hypothetical protein
MVHHWNVWYMAYVNATFPCVMIRFEDLIFHPVNMSHERYVIVLVVYDMVILILIVIIIIVTTTTMMMMMMMMIRISIRMLKVNQSYHVVSTYYQQLHHHHHPTTTPMILPTHKGIYIPVLMNLFGISISTIFTTLFLSEVGGTKHKM